jgi:hypothetical protein
VAAVVHVVDAAVAATLVAGATSPPSKASGRISQQAGVPDLWQRKPRGSGLLVPL